jgi:hypothetical protein
VVLNHADHMFARDHADEVAPLILNHLDQGLQAEFGTIASHSARECLRVAVAQTTRGS